MTLDVDVDVTSLQRNALRTITIVQLGLELLVYRVGSLNGLDPQLLECKIMSDGALIALLARPTWSSKVNREKLAASCHTIFGMVAILIPLVSWNPFMLILQATLGIVALISRKRMHGCLFRAIDNDRDAVPISTKNVDWDVAFGVLSAISLAKLAVLQHYAGNAPCPPLKI